MSEQPQFESTLDQRLLTLRIIDFAIAMGAVTALAIFVFLRMQGQFPPPPDPPLVSAIAWGVGILDLLVYMLVSRQVPAINRRRLATAGAGGSPEEWLNVYQSRLIIQLALLEGATFFFLIAYLLEGLPWNLVGAGVMLLGMLTLFPTRSGIESWIANQRELAQQEGQAGM
jgi:hypothetical protein